MDKLTVAVVRPRPNCMNILISNSSLITILSKVLLFKLGPYFNVENIYSSAKTSEYSFCSIQMIVTPKCPYCTTGKEHVLNQVLNKFGTNCTYIVVGKARDEYQLSKKVCLCSNLE